MKITQIETKVYEDKLLPQLFVSINTDEGLQGVGEADAFVVHHEREQVPARGTAETVIQL